MADLEDQALNDEPQVDTPTLLDTLLAALSPSEAEAATRHPPTRRATSKKLPSSSSSTNPDSAQGVLFSPFNPGRTYAEKQEYTRTGVDPTAKTPGILEQALLDAGQSSAGSTGGGSAGGWQPAEEANRRRIDERGGIYKDEKGNYVQRPNFQTKPYPIITNLAQLGEVLKHLAGAPDELKTHLLSQWTGIELTPAKVQQLQNTITAAKARFEAAAPEREQRRQEKIVQFTRQHERDSQSSQRAGLANLKNAISVIHQRLNSPNAGDPASQPGSPENLKLQKLYSAYVDEYTKRAKPEQTDGQTETNQPATSTNQTGIKVTKLP